MGEQPGGQSGPDTYDVVVIGAGLSGIATALSAALRGARAVVLEKEPKLQGASWWSGGQVWVPANHVQRHEGRPDSLEEGMAYVRGYSAEHPETVDEDALKRWLSVAPEALEFFERQGAATFRIIPSYPDYEYPDVPGSRAEGRYLTAVYDARRLGEWRERLSLNMFWPVGTTYEELLSIHAGEVPADAESTAGGVSAFAVSSTTTHATADLARGDLLTMGPGVVAGFFVRAVEEGVEVRLGHRVTEILMDDGRAVGVTAQTGDGATATLRGPVVIATSGFDHDPELLEEFSGSQDVVSVAPPNISGDGIRLARAAGAAIFAMPRENSSVNPGYRTHLYSGYAPAMELSMPHAFVVDRHGKRFADDATWWRLARAALDPDGDHRPTFLIWDEQHHQRYGLGQTPAGAPYPDGLVTSAPTLRELGERLGIDGEALEQTAQRFNTGAADGVDPDFGRGTGYYARVLAGDPTHPIHPNVGPVQQPPFHGMRLLWGGGGVSNAGVRIDADAHALDEDGNVIPGLYAVGAAAAFTTSGVGYNSGYSLSRCITHGYLVGAEVAGAD